MSTLRLPPSLRTYGGTYFYHTDKPPLYIQNKGAKPSMLLLNRYKYQTNWRDKRYTSSKMAHIADIFLV